MHVRLQLALAVFLALFTTTAFAYIDPNIGGYIFQLLSPLAAIIISIYIFLSDQVKAIWRSFLGFFKRKTDSHE